jgi:hypothetical protein
LQQKLFIKKTIMKNILLFLSITLLFVACGDQADTTSAPIVPVNNNAILADTAKAFIEPITVSQPKQATAKRSLPKARHRTTETTYQQPVETAPVTTPVPTSTDVNTVPSGNTDTSPTTGTTSTIPQTQKKGWSKAAKGAVIGGVAGAVGGAIISKKKGLGAVIGGVVGAAGGYAIGKKMDKKDNRLITN